MELSMYMEGLAPLPPKLYSPPAIHHPIFFYIKSEAGFTNETLDLY